MIKIITRLIMLSLVFVLMLSVFIGCAEPPSDRNESDTPPSSEQENGNPEDEIVPEPDKHVDGYLLSIDGAPLAYIENEETVKTIVDSLIQIRSESLSNAGKNVQSVEITSSFELELVK
ncbi:MAG: hypothetical protein IJY04_05635, partial [Clostridia bacterium]|nr:hypothetical protein [Clostridia bacterium]